MILDITAEDVSIEIQPEAGLPGRFKLYIHDKNGETLVRVCKLEPSHLIIPSELFKLGAQVISEPDDPPITVLAECSLHRTQYPASQVCQLCVEDARKESEDMVRNMEAQAIFEPSDFERSELR